MSFRLHSRLILLNGCAIIVITFLLGYFLSSAIRRTMESDIEDQLSNSLELAKSYINLSFGQDDPNRLADDLARSLHVRITIMAPDGTVLGDSEGTADVRTVVNHSDRPEVIEALKTGGGTSIRRDADTGRPRLYIASVVADGRILRLARPLSTVDGLIARLHQQLIVAMLAAIMITLIFGYMVYVLVSRPLRRMADVSQIFATGQLDHQIPVGGDADLTRLGSSLNAMAKSLHSRMEELVEDRRHIEAIIEGMSAGVVVFDEEGRAVLANKSIRQLLDLRGDPKGRTPMELVRHSAIENAVRQGLNGIDVPTVDVTTAGGKTLSAKATPVQRASGQVEQVVVVFHDLTELRRTERMRKDFVANVSHEFKTPLTSIRGYAETLLSSPPTSRATMAEFLQAIERNARFLQALVEDLLVLAQLESEPPVQKRPFNIRSLIDEHLHSRMPLLEEKGMGVQVDCPSVEILADRGRLSRAISNLLDNAIHYNRPSGQIHITGRETSEGFSIDIADTGFGIPHEDLPRVFERFYRVEKSRTRDTGGTGLGLAIVKHAVESQGGSVSVASKLGVGSIFTIMLRSTGFAKS